VESSPTDREEGSLEALPATPEAVDAHRRGAAPQLAVLRGAMRSQVIVHLAGEVALVAKRQAGVEVEDAQPTEVLMADGLLTVAAMADGLRTAVQRLMEARHHTAEVQPTAATMATAPHTEDSTLAAVHLVGEAHRAMLPRSRAVFLLLPQAHTMHPLQVPMQPRLLELTAVTQRLRPAARPWTHQRPVTSLLLHLEIPDTSTELRLPLHPRQGLGANPRRQRRVEKIQAIIEEFVGCIVKLTFP
jgi:hypothetical protein